VSDFERRRLSFGAAAELYDRARPTYPAEAARWLLGEEPVRVADVGAGTGIFSRVLASLGHRVLAVEPDEAMRATLAARSPGVEVAAGSAEALPLGPGDADAVVSAQAYHWFDHDRAHAEAARVLSPGGVYGVVWNDRDEREPWVAALSAIRGVGDSSWRRVPEPIEFGDAFGPVESATFRHAVPQTTESLLELVASRSWFLTAPAGEQRRVVRELRALTASLGEPFELPYLTKAYRACRRG